MSIKRRNHWTRRDLLSTDRTLILDDHAYQREAEVNEFGCVEYVRLVTHDEGTYHQTIHLCDIDHEIERLQDLKEHARQHFGWRSKG